MVDVSQSLRELTGVGEKVAPANARDLARQRIEIRNKPIRDLADEELHRAMKIGCDAEILIPIVIARLKKDPELLGLLCATLRAEFDWKARPGLVREVREILEGALNLIAQVTDDLDRLAQESAVLRSYADFERGLSSIPDDV